MIQWIKNKVELFRADLHMREIVRGAGLTLALKVMGIGLAFGFNVLLARHFGAEGSGIYFLALTMSTVCTVIGMFGLGTTSMRFIASFAENEQWSNVLYVSALALKISIPLLAATSALLFMFSEFLCLHLFSKPDLADPMRWMALAILPFGILQLFAEQLRGLRQITKAASIQGAVLPLLNILLLQLLIDHYAILGAVFSFLIASLLTMAVALIYWKSSCLPPGEDQRTLKIDDLLASCISMILGDIATRIVIPWAPFFLLGLWATTEEVGVFGMANRTAMLSAFVLVAVNSIAAPKFAALYYRRDMHGLDRIAKQSTMLMATITIPLIIAMAFFAKSIMTLFGDEFRQGSDVLIILLVGQFINVICGSVGYLLTMTGNERVYQRITFFSMVTMLVIAFNLIPKYGANGAAIAVSVTVAIQNLLFSYLGYQRLGISTLWFLKRKVCE